MRRLTLTSLALAAMAALPATAQQANVTASPPTNDTGSARYQGNGEGAGSASGISKQGVQDRVTSGTSGSRLRGAARLGRSTAPSNGQGIGGSSQSNRPVVGGNSHTGANALGQNLSNPTAVGQAGANSNGQGVQR